jgi:uncharacterized protein (DUF2252 family)
MAGVIFEPVVKHFMRTISRKLIEINQGRNADLLKIKYKFMHESLYRFFRGTNYFFYRDLAASGKLLNGPMAWICGDMHLENFGSFKGSNGVVYFDLNDFDDAVLAPAGWEAARMVTSIYIAFETLKIEREKADHMARLFLRSYAQTLAAGKADYVEEKTATGIVCRFLEAVGKRGQKTILEKRTGKKDHLSKDHPKHIGLEKEVKNRLKEHINAWLKEDAKTPYNYLVTDAVFRIAGTSSIGLDRYAMLLKSSNEVGDKYLLLDMKESAPAALTPHIKWTQPKWQNNAQRILFAQNIMQNRTPALLSSIVFNGKPFVIQEMQSTKDNIDFKLIRNEYRAMCEVIDSMGMLAASAQIRSSGRSGSANADALIAFGGDIHMQKDILDYAEKYARIVARQYQGFEADYGKGVFSAAGIKGKI